MKKLVLALAAVAVMAMVAAPAMAATQWNFGGMLRYMTFWDQSEGGKAFRSGDLQGGGADIKSDGILRWGTQANTRLMVWMKSDSLEGFIELGYDTVENVVWPREYWGRYQINDNLGILIGQQHQLYNSFISRQGGLVDLGMNGLGTTFRPPSPKIAINYGGTGGYGPFGPAGFSFALAQPETELGYTAADAIQLARSRMPISPAPPGFTEVFTSSYDEDTYLPQIQAAYAYMTDTWRMKVSGAYQWTKVKDISGAFTAFDPAGSPVFEFPYSISDKNIHTWLVAIEGEIAFGPLWLAANASVGQNWGNAGFMNSEFGNTYGDLRLHQIASAQVEVSFDPNNPASYSAKLRNTTSINAGIVAAYQLTEALRFEAGVGYRYDDNKIYKRASQIWNTYIQAAYTVAPGFEIVPEIGYIDRGKNIFGEGNEGYLWYAGAQWNMYF